MNNKLQYHLIPTEDASIIGLDDKANLAIAGESFWNHRPQHLYLTSDAPIKEGDWYMVGDVISKAQKSELECINSNFKKIEFTTDQKLIADGVPPIPEKAYIFDK